MLTGLNNFLYGTDTHFRQQQSQLVLPLHNFLPSSFLPSPPTRATPVGGPLSQHKLFLSSNSFPAQSRGRGQPTGVPWITMPLLLQGHIPAGGGTDPIRFCRSTDCVVTPPQSSPEIWTLTPSVALGVTLKLPPPPPCPHK